MESYSAGGEEWHGYLMGSHDRGKQPVLVTIVKQYWSLV